MLKKMIVTFCLMVSFLSVNVFPDSDSSLEEIKKLVQSKNYEVAIEQLDIFIKANPSNTKAVDLILTTYSRMGKKLSYIKSINYFLDLGYDISMEHLKLGIADTQFLKDYTSMLRLTKSINAINPSDAENLNFMGLAYFYLKNYTLAQAAFYLSLSLDANYICMANLARNYEYLGNRVMARSFYRKALNISPNYERASSSLTRLSTINSTGTDTTVKQSNIKPVVSYNNNFSSIKTTEKDLEPITYRVDNLKSIES